MNYRYVLVVGIVLILAVGVGSAYYFLHTRSPTVTVPPSSSPTSSTTTSSGAFDFLVFTQKGIAMLMSPSGSFLGYERLYNLSTSSPVQTFYWDEYSTTAVPSSVLAIPLNNGTILLFNTTTMKETGKTSVGSSIGFIGIQLSPNSKYLAVADGPSGVVEVLSATSGQVVWQKTYDTLQGKTAYPCDVRWSPDGKYLLAPMKLNGTIDLIDSTTGAITNEANVAPTSQPYMASINAQGTQAVVEFLTNKTDGFYSFPSLKLIGTVAFNSTHFLPQRGVFTPDGSYYLEASASTNQIAVISTSNLHVVNMINLPPTSAPGFADIVIAPGGATAYAVQHGNPTTGGIIYLISLSELTSSSAVAGSIPLTTAPAIVLTIPSTLATYLADNVLEPPVTGLHC
ncbi:MAG: YncE family protein [Candidatus Marsarchaeota archaeon]|nr:YncE family protein [Candidatus Marsarchaeota archaeon]